MTPRELEVLARMASGLGNRAIAAELGIEYTTVRGHVQAVLEKLGARSRFDAVARAYRTGLVRAAKAGAQGPARGSALGSRRGDELVDLLPQRAWAERLPDVACRPVLAEARDIAPLHGSGDEHDRDVV